MQGIQVVEFHTHTFTILEFFVFFIFNFYEGEEHSYNTIPEVGSRLGRLFVNARSSLSRLYDSYEPLLSY